MRFSTVKTLSEIKLTGVKIDAYIVNDAFKSVTVTDKDGNLVRVTSPYSTVQLEIKAPPKTKNKAVLVVKGMPVVGDFEKVFDDEHEARAAMRDANEAGAKETAVEHRDVQVDADADADVSSDIPF
jgi:hypothetical protein